MRQQSFVDIDRMVDETRCDGDGCLEVGLRAYQWLTLFSKPWLFLLMTQHGKHHSYAIGGETQTEDEGFEFIAMEPYLLVIERLEELVEACLLLFVECELQWLFTICLQVVIDGLEAQAKRSQLLVESFSAVFKHVAPSTTFA